MRNKKATYSASNITSSILILIIGAYSIINFYNNEAFDTFNYKEFESVLIQKPKKTKRYQEIIIQIKECNYDISFSSQIISNLNKTKILTELKQGDTILIGINKVDFINHIKYTTDKGLLSGQQIEGLTLKTDEKTYISLEDYIKYYRKEDYYQKVFGIFLFIIIPLLFLLHIPVIRILSGGKIPSNKK